MNEQPNPLALADWLDTHCNGALDNRRRAATLLRTQHAEIQRKDALLRQALETLENSRSLEPVDVDWVKGERHSIIEAIAKELSQ